MMNSPPPSELDMNHVVACGPSVAEPAGDAHARAFFVDRAAIGALHVSQPGVLQIYPDLSGAIVAHRKALEVRRAEMEERVAEKVCPHAAESAGIRIGRPAARLANAMRNTATRRIVIRLQLKLKAGP